jgi:hypothetical protein
VVFRMKSVAVRGMGMMRGFFVVAVLVVFRRGAMVPGCMFVMFCCFVVMLDVGFGHGILSIQRI